MSGPASALVPRLLLALAWGTVAAAGAEALLRRLEPAGTVFYQADASALYRLRPGAHARYHYPWLSPGEEVEVAINSRGFRGAELASPKTAARVVVYGDSFIEARSTRLADTFPARIEAALRARGHGSLEVVNAGVTGYGPDQVLARLDADLALLQPDLVILALYAGNDWGDLVRDQLWSLDAGGHLERGAPLLDEPLRAALEERSGFRALATVRAASRFWAELRDPGPTAGKPGASIEAVLRECQREYADSRRRPGRVTNLFRDHYDADVSALPRSESASYKRRLMAEVLAAAGRVVATRSVPVAGSVLTTRSVPLMLLAIPAASDVSDAHPHRVDGSRFPEYRPETLTDGIEEIAGELGLPVVNLFGPFRERRGAALYYPIDGHWNAAAQALAAQLVADRIVAEALLP
jgi:hypothetical protein